MQLQIRVLRDPGEGAYLLIRVFIIAILQHFAFAIACERAALPALKRASF